MFGRGTKVDVLYWAGGGVVGRDNGRGFIVQLLGLRVGKCAIEV